MFRPAYLLSLLLGLVPRRYYPRLLVFFRFIRSSLFLNTKQFLVRFYQPLFELFCPEKKEAILEGLVLRLFGSPNIPERPLSARPSQHSPDGRCLSKTNLTN